MTEFHAGTLGATETKPEQELKFLESVHGPRAPCVMTGSRAPIRAARS